MLKQKTFFINNYRSVIPGLAVVKIVRWCYLGPKRPIIGSLHWECGAINKRPWRHHGVRDITVTAAAVLACCISVLMLANAWSMHRSWQCVCCIDKEPRSLHCNRDARISCKLSVIRTDSGIFHYLYLYTTRDICIIFICSCNRPAKC